MSRGADSLLLVILLLPSLRDAEATLVPARTHSEVSIRGSGGTTPRRAPRRMPLPGAYLIFVPVSSLSDPLRCCMTHGELSKAGLTQIIRPGVVSYPMA